MMVWRKETTSAVDRKMHKSSSREAHQWQNNDNMIRWNLQIHVSIIRLDASQQLVIVTDIDQNLSISSNSIVKDTEGT